MLGLKRLAVHLVNQHHFVAVCVFQRQAALVILNFVALHSPVLSREEYLDSAGINACIFEHWAERCSGPFSGADGLQAPGLADRPRLQQRSPVAGALHRDGHRDRLTALDIIQ